MARRLSLPAFLGPARPVPAAAPEPDRADARFVAHVGLARAGAADEARAVSNLFIEDQILALWCWAATAVALLRKYRPREGATQCRIASLFPYNGRRYACCGPDRPRCDGSQSMEEVLCEIRLLAPPKRIGGVDFDTIAEEIRRDRPVCVRVKGDRATMGHVILIGGFKIAGGRRYVSVLDPTHNHEASNRFEDVPFETLERGFIGGQAAWTHTYFIAP